MKTYSQYEIYTIIDQLIKKEMDLKNKYIEKNGVRHKDTLERFAIKISALSELYKEFK